VRNTQAVLALLVALLALAVLAGAAYAAIERPDVTWLEAGVAVPPAGFLALFSLSLASRARDVHQRTLGRAGGEATARLARALGLLALLLTLSAGIAFGVFGILVATDGLTEPPW
jgi:hypothetical protein